MDIEKQNELRDLQADLYVLECDIDSALTEFNRRKNEIQARMQEIWDAE